MARKLIDAIPSEGLMREVSHSLVLLALTASSVGGLLGIVAVATRALAR
jgi:hypothetical protein